MTEQTFSPRAVFDRIREALKAKYHSFGTFRAAYSGKDGFLQAIEEVFGQADQPHYYDLTDDLIRMYGQMDGADQKDFGVALNAFNAMRLYDVVKASQGKTIAEHRISDLARLKLAVNYGTGVASAPNYKELMDMETSHLAGVASSSLGHLSYRPDRAPYGPQWS